MSPAATPRMAGMRRAAPPNPPPEKPPPEKPLPPVADGGAEAMVPEVVTANPLMPLLNAILPSNLKQVEKGLKMVMDKPGKKVISIIWAGPHPLPKIADLKPERFGIGPVAAAVADADRADAREQAQPVRGQHQEEDRGHNDEEAGRAPCGVRSKQGNRLDRSALCNVGNRVAERGGS